MAEYDFTAVHRKGELNRNADFFSRWARYKEYEDQQRVIPPVINAIISDEAHWWAARQRGNRPRPYFEKRWAAIMGTHPRMSVAVVTTAATPVDVTTIVTAAQAPAAQAQAAQAFEQKADDSGLQETLPNTLEMKRIRETIV